MYDSEHLPAVGERVQVTRRCTRTGAMYGSVGFIEWAGRYGFGLNGSSWAWDPGPYVQTVTPVVSDDPGTGAAERVI